MNTGLLLNLYGRLANLMMGARICKDYEDEQAFKYYSQDFLSITEDEIDKAFDFMIPRFQRDLWGIIYREQKRVKETSPEASSEFVIVGEIPDVMRMIFELIRSCR